MDPGIVFREILKLSNLLDERCYLNGPTKDIPNYEII